MIINCPYCSVPVIKGMNGLFAKGINVDLSCRCPGCKRNLEIKMVFVATITINDQFKLTKLGEDTNIRLIE